MEFKSKNLAIIPLCKHFSNLFEGRNVLQSILNINYFSLPDSRSKKCPLHIILLYFIFFQCAWRGYSVRKRFNTNKFKRTRQRILVANSNVTEPMKLCNRTRSALDYLLKCKNLTTVREAFLHLGKDLSRLLF